MNVTIEDIEQYLLEVKDAVKKGNYWLVMNPKRQENIRLFRDYTIDKVKVKEIILGLTVMDFVEILQNEHKGYQHERLYVFGKDTAFLHKENKKAKTVSLYIKFNKVTNSFVYVISFHEQKRPVKYYFK